MIYECDYGSINYRLPGVDDVFMTMHLMGVDPQKSSDSEYMNENQMLFMANLIKKLDYFIDSFDLTLEGKKLESYAEVKGHLEMVGPLVAVAEKVIGSLNLGDAEKKP